jgi:chromate reductase, NAD(P)H dehydrogenase (quinone)
MAKILGIAGSTRTGSFNRSLLRAAAEVVPKDSTIEIASIKDIPLYDGDLEKEHGVPRAVEELKQRIVDADALLLVTPEYNNSIPGVFKNAIDWLTRPPKDIARVFGGRPVVLMGATPGAGGTRLAQAALLPVLATLGARPFLGKPVYVADAKKAFDQDGRLVDDAIRERVKDVLTAFVRFISDVRAASHAHAAE